MAKSNAVEKPAVDINALLAGAASQKAEKKGSSKIPVIQIPASVSLLAQRKQEIVTKIDALKAEDEAVSADIIEAVTPIYEQKCATEFLSSLKVPSTNGTSISVTWKNAYSAITTDAEPAIRNVVGASYDRWFTKQTVITVKDQSPETLTKLIEAVGAENFAKIFGVEQTIVPTATFTEEKYRNLTKEQRDSLQPVVKQYKPAIRAK